MTFTGDGNATAYTNAEDLVAAVWDGLTGEGSGFRYLTATDDPQLLESLAELTQTPVQGMSMGGME